MRKRGLFAKAASCAVSAVLVVGLCPAFALAQEGDAALAAAPLEVQADEAGLTATDLNIQASSVANSGGYASLVKQGAADQDTPSAALADKNGKLLFPYKKTWSRYYYTDGIVTLCSSNGYKYADGSSHKGYFNLDGSVALEEGYDCITPFNGGVTAVWTYRTGEWIREFFLINKQGEKVLDLTSTFGKLEEYTIGFGNDPELYEYSAYSGVLYSECESGEGLIPFWSYYPFKDSVLESTEGMKRTNVPAYGFMDAKGDIKISGQKSGAPSWTGTYGFGFARPFSDGMAAVGNFTGDGPSSVYGFVNAKGEIVIPMTYQDCTSFCDGYACVKKGGKWGVIDKTGAEVVPFEYEGSYGAGEGGLFAMQKDGKWGLVNVSNQAVVPFEYDDMSVFRDGVAYGIKGGELYAISDSSKGGGGGNAQSDLAAYAGKAKAAGFTDLDAGAWYMNAGGTFPESNTLYLDYTIAKGLMSGYSGTTRFAPDDDVSRAMVATIIYRSATGKTADTTNNDVKTEFSDVAANQWYSAAVAWCAEKGIVTGYAGTGRFGPDDPVTREQLATMVGRYCQKVHGMASAGENVSRFKDAASISAFAKEGVAFCAANAIVSGIGDTGNFQPQGKATRCQMSKIIAVTARLVE